MNPPLASSVASFASFDSFAEGRAYLSCLSLCEWAVVTGQFHRIGRKGISLYQKWMQMQKKEAKLKAAGESAEPNACSSISRNCVL